jgi:elongation factor Ts
MEISAVQVKDLREKTGLGMMICKQALIDAKGDMTLAIENLRKQGQATQAKRAGKSAKEGKVTVVTVPDCAIAYEVNSETDFVAANEDFISYVKELGTIFLAKKPSTIDEAKRLTSQAFGGQTVEARLTELIGKIGENIAFRRYKKIDADPGCERIFSYIHGNGRIGVIIKLRLDPASSLDNEAVGTLGKDLAMQIAAANPAAVDRESISPETIAKEKEIYLTQAQNSGKPEKIWEKIVDGKLQKFFQEVTLLEQGFIRDPDTSVANRIGETEKAVNAKVKVVQFVRFELGAEE